MPKVPPPNRYKLLAERIFFDHWSEGATEFEFQRDEMEGAATAARGAQGSRRKRLGANRQEILDGCGAGLAFRNL